MAKRKANKTTFAPGNQAALGHSEGKTGAPTKAAKADIRAKLESFEIEVAKDGKIEKKPVSIYGTALSTLYKALTAKDEFGQPNAVAMRAVENVLAYMHGPPKHDDADQRPPMTLVVNCAPIVNNQVNVGNRANHT